MSVIKYLLDENVDPGLRTGLHRNYPEMMVWCVGDPGERSTRRFYAGAKIIKPFW